MSNQWLRLWHDMPNDPKWRTIARASNQPISLVQAVYIHLLVDASRNVTRGHVAVTTEDLASALDVTEDAVIAILDAMQGRVLDGEQLSGWDKRQPKREDSGSPETGAKSAAQRKRDQRERAKIGLGNSENVYCHDMSHNVTTDKDKDTEKDNTPLTPQGEKFDAAKLQLPMMINRTSWIEWVEYRKSKRKPVSERAAEKQLELLGQYDQPTQARMIAKSIQNDYQGLFEPDPAQQPQEPVRRRLQPL